MLIPLDPKLLDSPILNILAIATLADVMRRLIRRIQSLNRALPKSFWRNLAKGTNYAIKYIVKEVTPPKPSTIATRTAKVIFAAIFYVLVVDCTCLLIIDSVLIWTSDASSWRKLLGTAVLLVIAFNWRFCLNQGEKLRAELKTTSRVLW